MDGGGLRAAEQLPNEVVDPSGRFHTGITQGEVQHLFRTHLPGAEKAVFPDLTHNIALGAHLDEGFRQIHSATSRSTQQRSFKWTLAQRLKATWGG